jgi:hypothetical protein
MQAILPEIVPYPQHLHALLQRRLRIVVLLNRKDPAKPRFIVLGSTDPRVYS